MNTKEQKKDSVELTQENFANKSSQRYSRDGEFIERMKIVELMKKNHPKLYQALERMNPMLH